MTKHIYILFVSVFVSLNSAGQNSNELAAELFDLATAEKDTFFLSEIMIRTDSSVLQMNRLKDSLTSEQLASIKKCIKDKRVRFLWEKSTFQNSILVPNTGYKKTIGAEYRKSEENIFENYWGKYRFDTLYGAESDSLRESLKKRGITPDKFATVPHYFKYIYHISNPVISSDGRFAIIQIEKRSSSGALDGAGFVYVFKRINNSWSLILKELVWVS